MKPDHSVKTKILSLGVFSSREQYCILELSTVMEMVYSCANSQENWPHVAAAAKELNFKLYLILTYFQFKNARVASANVDSVRQGTSRLRKAGE